MKIHESKDETQTMELAAGIARKAKPGDIFALTGNLGAGKSVFARGFIRALCGQDTDIPSPTFTLMQSYDSDKGPVYHFDLYRLEYPEEVLELNWDEALADGICLIERPNKAGTLLNLPYQSIEIKIEKNGSRQIIIGTV